MSRRTVCIGHGRSPQWLELKEFLVERLNLDYEEYNRVPTAGQSRKERLLSMLNSSDFAFLVLTAEDEGTDEKLRARSNVVHEAGLFQGRLGFEKAIVLLEEGCEEFSNISGLDQIRFPPGDVLGRSEQIRRVLEREGISATASNIADLSTQPRNDEAAEALSTTTIDDLGDAEDDAGLFDLQELFEKEMSTVTAITTSMSADIEQTGLDTAAATSELHQLNEGTSSRNHTKPIINRLASMMSTQASNISTKTPELRRAFGSAIVTLRKSARIAPDFKDSGEAILRDTRGATDIWCQALQSSLSSTKGYRDTLKAQPRITTAFNKAKRSYVAVLDEFLSIQSDMLKQVRDIDAEIGRLLEENNF